ncbi:MAG TPA: divergent PAP2 family protein [Candidatus Omnitrophota bacterium]|nr:divergent PAP2 family protein [Candidatus Omnitrophota bacterium]
MEPDLPVWRAYFAVVAAWVIAQSIKVIRNTLHRKRFSVRRLIDTGGMPSSHSAGTAAVATVVGLYSGFGSVLFLFALVFALVTMFDAASVRRSVGKQAIIMNKLVDEFYAEGRFSESRLREFLGHTPVEVLMGAALGIAVAFLICVW